MKSEDTCNKTYTEMQDGEIVPVYEYHYTSRVNYWHPTSDKAPSPFLDMWSESTEDSDEE